MTYKQFMCIHVMGGALCAWAGAPATVGATVTLVENGEPRAAIVLPAQPEPLERQAARELAEHLALMTGAELARQLVEAHRALLPQFA